MSEARTRSEVGMDEHQNYWRPNPWRNVEDMVAAYKKQSTMKLPAWKVFWYRIQEDYDRKLGWYSKQLASIPRSKSCLDIGCGVGELLARSEIPNNYIGVDAVPEFIELAKHRFPEKNFLCGDILRLEHKLEPADIVVMAGILGSSPHPYKLIDTALRLSKEDFYFDFFPLNELKYQKDNLQRLPQEDIKSTIARHNFRLVSIESLGASLAAHLTRVI